MHSLCDAFILCMCFCFSSDFWLYFIPFMILFMIYIWLVELWIDLMQSWLCYFPTIVHCYTGIFIYILTYTFDIVYWRAFYINKWSIFYYYYHNNDMIINDYHYDIILCVYCVFSFCIFTTIQDHKEKEAKRERERERQKTGHQQHSGGKEAS